MPTDPHPINKALHANGIHAPVMQVHELPMPYKLASRTRYLKRTADGCVRSTGNEALDTLAFLHLLEHLKVCRPVK